MNTPVEPTVAALIACGIGPTQARLFSAPLTAACAKYEITTRGRLAAFLAQCFIESAGFTKLEESLYYTHPERIRQVWPNRVQSLAEAAEFCRQPQKLANRVYGGRYGNGNESTGDGWRYRGRGLKMLTFHDNYADAEAELGRPYLLNPDLVALPEDAAMVGAWFWHTIKGNMLADSWQIDMITRGVNGPGMLLADERRSRSDDNARALA